MHSALKVVGALIRDDLGRAQVAGLQPGRRLTGRPRRPREPGQFTAEDARDGSVFAGAAPEDLLTAAGAHPAQAGDYAINWIRPVSALRPDP